MFGYSLPCFVVLSSLFILPSTGDGDESNYFVNPPWLHGSGDTFESNNVYSLGSTLNLNWETNFSTISLALWQRGNTSSIYLINRQPVSKGFMWHINVDGEFDIASSKLSTPNVFSLELQEMIENSDQVRGRFSCPFFNITKSDLVTSTMSTASSASTSASTSGVLANTPEDETSPAQTSSAPPSGGLSNDAKIAIGVGVSVGAVCLLLGATTAIFFWRKSKKALAALISDPPLPEQGMGQGPSNPPNGPPAKAELCPTKQLGELSAEMGAHELSSAQNHELPASR